VDVTQIPVGPSGRITREDVEAFATSQRAQPAEPPAAPTSQPRQQAAPPSRAPSQPAERTREPAPAARPGQAGGRAGPLLAAAANDRAALVEAQQTAAMLTTFNEVDMSAVMAMRAKHKESFKERHGIGLGFMSFFVKASIGALKAFPQVNAELQGTS